MTYLMAFAVKWVETEAAPAEPQASQLFFTSEGTDVFLVLTMVVSGRPGNLEVDSSTK